jgi:hypothetical protein
MKYIYHHLGLGDHIICNGLVRSLINENEEYKMFVKPHNLISVSFMYRDLENLSFIVGDDVYVNNFIRENNLKKNDLIIAGFYRHPKSKEFDDSFYLQNDLPFENRWDNFKCVRDIDREMSLFKKYNIKENEYVFLHDDVNRNFEIDRDYILNKELKIVTPINEISDNIFDYCYLMENSIESHFIDSSFKLIFDSFKLRNNNLFYHINLKNGVVKDIHTKSQSTLNFKII